MNHIKRKQYILQKLQAEGSAGIAEMADELGVSAMTIRRDIKALSENNLVNVANGEAVLNNGSLFEYNMALKQEEKAAEKKRIAAKCLEYISEGESIYLDAGTTVSAVAAALEGKNNIVLMTHSLLAACVVAGFNSNIKMIMCPGEFRETSMAFMGALTTEFISQFRIDTLFLAVEGIDLENGVSVPDVQDGITKKALIDKAKRVICVADSSKFGKAYLYSISPLSKIDLFITDSGIDAGILEQYRQRNIEVITV